MTKTVGNNLKIARMRSNLSMSAAGELLNISNAAIFKYENNTIIASLQRLEEFAKIYNTNLEELLDVEDNLKIKFTNFKCRKKTSEIKKEKIKYIITEKINSYFNLLKLSDITLHNKFGVHMVSTLLEAGSLASKLRIFFNLPLKDPISNLVYLLESNGMMIITLPKDKNTINLIGFYEIINNVPVIVVLQESNGYEQRYSIAKYLGELLIINDYKKDELTTEFALSLLIPKQSILEEFGDKRIRIDFKELEIFSNNYKVSYKNIVNRLSNYNIITPSNAKYLKIYINKNNIKEKDYYEEPFVYEKLAAKLRAKGIIKKN
ncbi:MAG: XRE family transcriptional regulator [Bacilli bacterium]|nr:XRE family transcriptional regulator [Bacilli bacterium]MDD3895811.1 XRE family transcriptional regulator [Bacilli bacterium]MDD4407848.1 XRE family transcriptional regulator [Bacilli bacterium]